MKRIGYSRVNMDSGWDIHAKIKITLCKGIADSLDKGIRTGATSI
jgi:hypothetical protein